MVRLHAEFRRSHGLPPLPTAWSLLEYLRTLRGRSSLVDPQLLRSRRPAVGGLLGAARTFVGKFVKPVFHRQSAVNHDLIVALEALARDRDETRRANHALTARVFELETTVAWLAARVNPDQ